MTSGRRVGGKVFNCRTTGEYRLLDNWQRFDRWLSVGSEASGGTANSSVRMAPRSMHDNRRRDNRQWEDL